MSATCARGAAGSLAQCAQGTSERSQMVRERFERMQADMDEIAAGPWPYLALRTASLADLEEATA